MSIDFCSLRFFLATDVGSRSWEFSFLIFVRSPLLPYTGAILVAPPFGVRFPLQIDFEFRSSCINGLGPSPLNAAYPPFCKFAFRHDHMSPHVEFPPGGRRFNFPLFAVWEVFFPHVCFVGLLVCLRIEKHSLPGNVTDPLPLG